MKGFEKIPMISLLFVPGFNQKFGIILQNSSDSRIAPILQNWSGNTEDRTQIRNTDAVTLNLPNVPRSKQSRGNLRRLNSNSNRVSV